MFSSFSRASNKRFCLRTESLTPHSAPSPRKSAPLVSPSEETSPSVLPSFSHAFTFPDCPSSSTGTIPRDIDLSASSRLRPLALTCLWVAPVSLTATLTARSSPFGNSTMPLFLAESSCTPAMISSPSAPESSSAMSSDTRNAAGSRGGPSSGARSLGAPRRPNGDRASSLRRLSEAAAEAVGSRRTHPSTRRETTDDVRHTRRYI
mmetsp:Transcript_11047/g.51120  ORF Transcript_11047/g.51120 Transcript_11047/m.51120 type:complete len:206 (+) Transcript_11047:710-1327(+)